ncbi:caspase, EACC1-associated type [Nocardia sp. CA-107356]|uniref:caspase, EACC1-associated type n=1 Tax=Nocardia sp. CA-107356 TaxID=3239972 RepID=UPI003D92A0D6
MVAGKRSALIVACDNYLDPSLRKLRAPTRDAQALAGVLQDPLIGGFEVHMSVNEPAHVVGEAVEGFFADRVPEDLLLLHFSCHGVKDEDGELYFAASNTKLGRLGATGVAAEFVNRRMNRSRSRRIVLLLDCCYAGAFERGMTHRAGTGMNLEQLSGRGRAVITASSAMEYSFESGELTDTADGDPSVFTGALVDGLSTGEADRNQDGFITLDELYDYVYGKVRSSSPNQTPGKWVFGVQGELYIARRNRRLAQPILLPVELQMLIDNPLPSVRAVAVRELEKLLRGKHLGLAEAAQQNLRNLTEDDSRAVSAAAEAALHTDIPSPGPLFPAPITDQTKPPSPASAESVEPPPPHPFPDAAAAFSTEPQRPRPQRTQLPPPSPEPLGKPRQPSNEPVQTADARQSDPVMQPRIAGALMLCSAVLMACNPFVPYGRASDARVLDLGPEAVALAFVMAALAACAGISLLGVHRGRLIGAGIALGFNATVPWFLWNQWGPWTDWGAATWLWFVALQISVLAAGFAASTIIRTAGVHLRFQLPTDPGAWTMGCIGLGIAPLLLYAVTTCSEAPQRWGVLSLIVMALAVPICAAVAVPRRFGVTLLGGWCGAAGLVVYYSIRLPTPDNLNPEVVIIFVLTMTVAVTTAAIAAASEHRTVAHSPMLTHSRDAR